MLQILAAASEFEVTITQQRVREGRATRHESDEECRSAARLRVRDVYGRLVESDRPGTDDAAEELREASPTGTKQVPLAGRLERELLEDADDT